MSQPPVSIRPHLIIQSIKHTLKLREKKKQGKTQAITIKTKTKPKKTQGVARRGESI